MAWEEFDSHGQHGFTGDKPIDEFALAIQRVTAAFEDRFQRKPSLAEVVYPFLIALRGHAGVPSDFAANVLKLLPARTKPLDFAAYEAAYQETPEPGFHVIQTKRRKDAAAVEVVRVLTLQSADRKLACRYEIRSPGMDDEQAQALVARVLLHDFYDDDYRDEADSVEFVNAVTGARTTIKML